MLSVVLFKILYHSNKICDQGSNFGHGDLKNNNNKNKEKSITIILKRILLFFLKYPIFYNQAKIGL